MEKCSLADIPRASGKALYTWTFLRKKERSFRLDILAKKETVLPLGHSREKGTVLSLGHSREKGTVLSLGKIHVKKPSLINNLRSNDLNKQKPQVK